EDGIRDGHVTGVQTCALPIFASVADGRKCGMRSAECGVDARPSIPHSTFRTPHSASLTIGRLHYDGGGDWYAGPSALPNLLAALDRKGVVQGRSGGPRTRRTT